MNSSPDALRESAAKAAGDKQANGGRANGARELEAHLETIPASQIEAKPIVPLLPGMFYVGKVTIIAGLPGDAKSLLSIDIAARISTGSAWPVGAGKFAQARALMLTAEDDPADTIRPRLDVAGANADLVELIKGVSHIDSRTGARALDPVRLMADLPLIEKRIEELKPALFIIDPLTSFAGSDTEKTADMRVLLDLIGKMAARAGIAILIITHLNKRSDARKAMQMIAGSHVITAAVRVVLVTSRDPNNRQRRLVLPTKNNIDKDAGGGFAFTVNGAPHTICGETPAIAWERERVTDISADDALIDQTPRAQAAVAKANEVQDWLRDLLRFEPVAAATMWAQAKEKGYGNNRVRNALKAIGAAGEPLGFRGAWHYRLPRVSNEATQGKGSSLGETR